MPDAPAYDPQSIETRWQRYWDEQQTFKTRDDLPREQCYYVLEMFPYPSGKLHMGHVRNYTIGDAVARYKRMRGFHVLHPMGWDSFGLPAEQAAIERGRHPRTWTYDNIAYMRGQLQRMGFSYDWTRELATSDAGYSQREQELFLDLVEQGLVFRKSSLVNWSTGLNTVLANEQVVDGRCWRTGTPVVQKELPQWFLRITAYAEELLAGTETLTGWPEAVRAQQRNWIGRSEGAEIDFPVVGHPDLKLTVFTTRPDTVFGVTFMSIAPEHPLLDRIVAPECRATLEAFRQEVRRMSPADRLGDLSEKKGVATGAQVINPANGQAVPVYAANFVLAEYGTGAVMAVPAHDTRDFAFAQRQGLPVVKVIREDGTADADPLAEAFTGIGTMIGSAQFNGQRSETAKAAITAWLAGRDAGRAVTTWRLRDWLLSRQRYWGNPIPFLRGESLGFVPVRKADLPVSLPDDVVLDGRGNPLEKHPTWAQTGRDGQPLRLQTPSGWEPARRETDTMDTFVDSSWYFARFTCPEAAAPLDKARVNHWLPVDLYIGGIEHACMHLLYARFFMMALSDCGHASVREPFKRLLCQGMVTNACFYREGDGGRPIWFGLDEIDIERGAKGEVVKATAKADGQPVIVGAVTAMSKSKRNGVDPQALIDAYGADTVRLFILFAAPPEKELEWNDSAVAGAFRFLRRVWNFTHANLSALQGVTPYAGKVAGLVHSADQVLLRKVHAAVKRATEAMERDFGFNTAISACMELFNALSEDGLDQSVQRQALETLVRILAPMAPHICCELWQVLGHPGSIDTVGWPAYDDTEIAEALMDYPVQVAGRLRGHVRLAANLDQAALAAAALADPAVKALIGTATVRKVIAVPGKVINLVLG